jgi:hypothetical protein
MERETKAFTALIGKKIDYKNALDLVNDAEIRDEIVKIQSIKNIKERNKALDDYLILVNKSITLSSNLEAIQTSPVNKEIERLNILQKFITLNEKLIDLRNAPTIKKYNDELEKQDTLLQSINDQIKQVTDSQIKPIQAIIDANNFALESISLQEDAINETYNKQIEALDKIAIINQNIANIQKQRLSIADALTRGDISSAAQLAQEARAEQAQSAVSTQKDMLTSSRDAQIAALGRLAIEKQNKELQLQISIIEQTRLLNLEIEKTKIEDTIEATSRKLKILNDSVEKEKESAIYSGETKKNIDDLAELLQAAEAAGIPFDDVLLSQATNAKSLAKALQDALTAQQALASFSGSASGAGSAKTKPFDPSFGGAPVPKTPLYQYNSLAQSSLPKMAVGGLVPGNGMVDKIATLLTPGEYVINKNATKQFKPLLSTLNESKYPSMLGSKIGAQTPINNVLTSMNDNSTAVYNYSLGFNINGTNSNANDIARAVMREIKNVDSQRIRGQRV